MSKRTDSCLPQSPVVVDAYPVPATVHNYRSDMRVASRAFRMESLDRSPTVPQQVHRPQPSWQVAATGGSHEEYLAYGENGSEEIVNQPDPRWKATACLRELGGPGLMQHVRTDIDTA